MIILRSLNVGGLASKGSSDCHSVTVVNAKTLRSRIQQIATWNICTLYQQRKLDNVVMGMDRTRINCFGLCEVRWTENSQFLKDVKTVIYSGGREHQSDVALILDRKLSKPILGCWPKYDCLKASPFNINLIVAYAPTLDANEQMIEFYDLLYSNCKSQKVNIMMGDFNAKVGCEKHGKTVRPHGLGTHNE